VADSAKRARAAAKKVVVSVSESVEEETLDDPLVDLAAARINFDSKSPIARRMRPRRAGTPGFEDGVTVNRGDVDEIFAKLSNSSGESSLQQLEGRIYLGGQKHFFMETQASVAEPDEGNRINVTCGTQYATFTQEGIAMVLGLPSNQVSVKVRRVGGGFGGKINMHFKTAAASAIAAVKLGVPVAIHNERVDDMMMMGGREPIELTYKVAVDAESGVTTALHMHFAMDGGINALAAVGSLSMATAWSDGCYFVENFKASGELRFSARPENTSCRLV
jgi:xanthine dehydrogenase large subunit